MSRREKEEQEEEGRKKRKNREVKGERKGQGIRKVNYNGANKVKSTGFWVRIQLRISFGLVWTVRKGRSLGDVYNIQP